MTALGLHFPSFAPFQLQRGFRCYVTGCCSPTLTYDLEFVVAGLSQDLDVVTLGYAGGFPRHYYRLQTVLVPLFGQPVRLRFAGTYDFEASSRPPLLVALLKSDAVRLLVGTLSPAS